MKVYLWKKIEWRTKKENSNLDKIKPGHVPGFSFDLITLEIEGEFDGKEKHDYYLFAVTFIYT